MKKFSANTTQPENPVTAPGGGHKPGAFSALGFLVAMLLFLCAGWALFILDASGLSSSATMAKLPVPRAAGAGGALEDPFKSPPINAPDKAFTKTAPAPPPPPPAEAEKPEIVEKIPSQSAKPAETAKTSPPRPSPAITLKPTLRPAPPAPRVNPKNPPREIVERAPEPKTATAASGEAWYSVRAGYSDSRSRTDTLRQVLASRGFANAVTERDKDGLYYVRVDEFRFRHLADETFKEIEGMGLEPTLHERTAAK